MKTLEDLNKENSLQLVHSTTLSEVLENVPSQLKSKTVRHTWPLKFGHHRIKIELQLIVGSEAVVWTGPKTLLLGRKPFHCLSHSQLYMALVAGVESKWKWEGKVAPRAFVQACIELLEKIPSPSAAPDLATEETPEEPPLEHQLNLV